MAVHRRLTVHYIKKSPIDWIFDIFNWIMLSLFMFACIFPIWYVFAYSISDPQEAARGITLIPRGLTLFNYSKVMSMNSIYRATVISVARTVIGTGLVLFACSFFGYLVSKKEMWFRKFVYRSTIITMYFSAGLIPYYLWIRTLGLRNNYLVYVIPGMVSAFYVILIKTFIEQLPDSLEESAKLDGAGYVQCYARIVLPLIKPILATIVVFTAVGQWNSFMDAFLFTSRPEMQPLQLMLWRMLQQTNAISRMLTPEEMGVRAQQLTPITVRMTITMITIIPIMLVYPFAQKYFTKGLLLGAIKG